MDFYKAVQDYGVALISLGSVATFLAWLVRYVLRENARREQWLGNLVASDLKHLSEHQLNLVEAVKKLNDEQVTAHSYQREEHNKMIEVLTKLSVSQ